MIDFLNGSILALNAVAALLFLRFWKQTRDRLFLWFAISFATLSLSRAVLAALPYLLIPTTEHTTTVYGVRLLAYVLILVAIIDKSRRGAAAGRGEGMS